VRDKKFTLKEKLILMGLVTRTLSRFPADDNLYKSIDGIISEYRERMRTQGFLSGLLQNMEKIHADIRKEHIVDLARTASGSAVSTKKIPDIVNAKYYQLIADFKQAAEDGAISDYITESFDKLIVPYVNSNGHIFENYLAYTLVSSKFLASTNNFASAYVWLVGQFLTMLTFASGIFHENETISHDEMVAAIYLFHRSVSHNEKLQKALEEIFMGDTLSFVLSALGEIK
jgi:hypothetical protein